MSSTAPSSPTAPFGAPYEGPPGFVHGGWIACAFDEVLGIANIASGNPGMTARLTVHYRKPTPLFRELRFRAWVDRVEGRRIMSQAEVYDGDTLTAEAEGIFVQPRPELAEQYFGPQPRDRRRATEVRPWQPADDRDRTGVRDGALSELRFPGAGRVERAAGAVARAFRTSPHAPVAPASGPGCRTRVAYRRSAGCHRSAARVHTRRRR